MTRHCRWCWLGCGPEAKVTPTADIPPNQPISHHSTPSETSAHSSPNTSYPIQPGISSPSASLDRNKGLVKRLPKLHTSHDSGSHSPLNSGDWLMAPEDKELEFSQPILPPIPTIRSSVVQRSSVLKGSRRKSNLKRVYPEEEEEKEEKRASVATSRASVFRTNLTRSFSDLKQRLVGTPPVEYEHVKIHIVTWNMNGKLPKVDLKVLLGEAMADKCHIIAIGSQECEKSIEKSLVFPSKEVWEGRLNAELSHEYKMIKTETLGAIHLAIFCLKSFKRFILDSESGTVATGIGKFIGNKGSVAIALKLERTSILFVTSHFAAHQTKIAERNNDYKRTSLEMKLKRFSSTAEKLEDQFDYVFWFGDLNYRINGTKTLVENLIAGRRLEVLQNNDQLGIEMKKARAFVGFQESDIQFPPTYKFDTADHLQLPVSTTALYGPTAYDTRKARIPSWTDRILYRVKNETTSSKRLSVLALPLFRQGNGGSNSRPGSAQRPYIKVEQYDAIPDFVCSDHKPVIGTFVIEHCCEKLRLKSTDYTVQVQPKKSFCAVQ